MTEAEWLACADPTPMLSDLGGQGGARKLRLFACACCLRAGDALADPRVRRWVGVAERLADGAATDEERTAAFLEGNSTASALLMRAEREADPRRGRELQRECLALRAAYSGCFSEPLLAARRSAEAAASAACASEAPDHPGRPQERRHQAALLRCLLGNPLRPARPDPSWRTPNAVVLARTIYDERCFELLPLLADLLEEIGCPAEVSEHCRSGGPHARGCWVVDLLLGKG